MRVETFTGFVGCCLVALALTQDAPAEEAAAEGPASLRELDGLKAFVKRRYNMSVPALREDEEGADAAEARDERPASTLEDGPAIQADEGAAVQVVEVTVPSGSGSQAVFEHVMPREQLRRQIDDPVQAFARVRLEVSEAVKTKAVEAEVGSRFVRAVNQTERDWHRSQQAGKRRRLQFGNALGIAKEQARRPELVQRGRSVASTLAAEASTRSRGGGRQPPRRHTFAPGVQGVPPRASTPSLSGRMLPRAQVSSGFSNTAKPPPTPTIAAPKGVKIQIDDSVFRAAFQEAGAASSLARIAALEDALVAASSSAEAYRIVEEFSESLKTSFLKQAEGFRDLGQAHLVPLRPLLKNAQGYRDRWSERPEALKTIGGLTRINGFFRDEASGGLLIVGRKEPGKDAILLDDLTVGLRAAWRDGTTPTCSLDPDPQNFTARQTSRISGIPKDSPFALLMLQADYRMKQLVLGSDSKQTSGGGFRSLADIWRVESPSTAFPNHTARYWLSPVQPEQHTVHLGPGGRSGLFDAAVQLFSETMLKGDTSLIGTGTVHSIDRAVAESFSKHYDQLAASHPELYRLAGLFDVVMLGRLLRIVSPTDSDISALCDLPYDPAEVPKSYAAVRAKHKNGDRRVTLIGGCAVGTRVRPRALFESVAGEPRGLAGMAASTMSGANQASGVRLRLPQMKRGGSAAKAEQAYAAGTRRLAAGDFAGAAKLFSRATEAQPEFVEAHARRAIALSGAGRHRDALWAAAKAVDLAPEDASLYVLFHRLWAEAGADSSVESIQTELRRPLAQSYLADAIAHMIQGALESDRAEFVKAERFFGKYLEFEPGDLQAHVLRAGVRDSLEDASGALADLDHVLGKDGKHLGALLMRSIVTQRTGDTRKALAYAQKAISITEAGTSFDTSVEAACLARAADLHGTLGEYRTGNLMAQHAIALDDQQWLARVTLARTSKMLWPKDIGTEAQARDFLKAFSRTIRQFREALEYGKGMPGFKAMESGLRSELATLEDSYRAATK